MKIQCPHLLRTQGGHNKNIVISAYVSISSTGIRRFRYMTVSVHTLSVHVFFGTAVFGTLNVNIGTVTFGTYKISVQSTSAHKCQFRYNHLRYKGTLVLDKLKPFMVALWNRADHYNNNNNNNPICKAPECQKTSVAIFSFCGFFLSICLLSSFLSSPNLSVNTLDVYFHTWCGLSANLECRSEMCCTRLAEKKSPKIAIWHHRTTLSGVYFRN